jgi:large subunit ribosomal protein L10
MPTVKKEELVQELEEKFKSSQGLVFTEYRGLDANDMVELRKELRENDLEYRVVKNRLALLAASNAGITIDPEILKGPTAICFGKEDAALPCKLSVAIAKKFEPFVIKGGVIEGEMIDAAAVKELASMPSRDELLARLAGAFQAPIQKIAGVLNALLTQVAVVMNEVAKVKPEEAVAEAPAETAAPTEEATTEVVAEETAEAPVGETAPAEEAAPEVEETAEEGGEAQPAEASADGEVSEISEEDSSEEAKGE